MQYTTNNVHTKTGKVEVEYRGQKTEFRHVRINEREEKRQQNREMKRAEPITDFVNDWKEDR